jgi:hypothetical protein
MGLLDDAIREHLELKRLRGADPGEVAREQREALDAVPRDEHAARRDNDSAAAGVLTPGASDEAVPLDATPVGDPPAMALEPAQSPDFSNAPQETAELDMRTVMDEHEGVPADNGIPADPVAAPPAGNAAAGEHPDEDSLEWEVPGEPSRQPAADTGHQGRVLGDDNPLATAGERGHAKEPAEDVLETTPDFMRDTPEQERLWFEQRPPRDFDFDK